MSETELPVLQGTELEAAEKIFGDRLPLAKRYVEHIATSGIERPPRAPRSAPPLGPPCAQLCGDRGIHR